MLALVVPALPSEDKGTVYLSAGRRDQEGAYSKEKAWGTYARGARG